jgi:hypothetical protein
MADAWTYEVGMAQSGTLMYDDNLWQTCDFLLL